MNDSRLKELKSFYDMGAALIVLEPKSKAILESGWTKVPRYSWDEFARKLKPKSNVGVRLGEASRFENGFLACIDCDVKSRGDIAEDEKHQKEMFELVKREFPESAECPTVVSGSGLGRHIYFLTKEPIEPVVIGRSDTLLSLEGYKKPRPAWEVTVYSEGRQMVVPPSIHPSGGVYTWKRHFGKFPPPLIERGRFVKHVERRVVDDPIPEYTLEEPKTLLKKIPEELRAPIVDGVGVDDRSGAIYSIAGQLFKHGLKPDEVLSIFMTEEFHLGAVGLERRGGDMASASQWVWKYCVGPAFRDHAPAADFTPVETELMPEWVLKLDRVKKGPDRGRIKPNEQSNATLLVENLLPKKFAMVNLFSKQQIWAALPPEEILRRSPTIKIGKPIDDDDIASIRGFINNHPQYPCNLSKVAVEDAVSLLANTYSFHPVRDYLDSLKWDGVPRIHTWLKDYLGAEGPDEYLRQVSAKVIMAMVARIYEPGVKFDSVLILAGTQNIGKSTVIAHLAGEEWFSDAPYDPANKDSILLLQGRWVVELGELSTLYRADINVLKSAITSRVDMMRPPYGKRLKEYPRESIFIGTTNNGLFLRDPTGNRRFWPVDVDGYDTYKAPIKTIRDQLFAESKVELELGETLYLTGKAVEQAQEIQAEKTEKTEAEQMLEKWLKKCDENPSFEGNELLSKSFSEDELIQLHFSYKSATTATPKFQNDLVSALKKLGFEKTPTRRHGVQTRLWKRKL